jgi:hypothetical protein
MLRTSEIVGMTAQEKADLVARGVRESERAQHQLSLALAEMERSEEFRESGFASVEDFAAARSGLEPDEVAELLRIGRILLGFPEVDDAYRKGRLSWAAVRDLAPQAEAGAATGAGAADSQADAGTGGSEASGRQAPKVVLDPATGEEMVELELPPEAWERFQRLAQEIRAEPGNEDLTDDECVARMIDLVKAMRDRADRGPRP